MEDVNANYEVCIKVGERWEIHARHPVTGANAAIEEAKQLSQSSKALVKVVREVYDDETGLYKQVVVFKSAGLAAAMKSESGASGSHQQGGRSGGGGGDKSYGSRGGGDNFFDIDDDDDDDDEFGDLYDGAASRRRRASKAKAKAQKFVTVPGLFFRISIYILLALVVAALVTGLLPVFAPKFATRNVAVMGVGEASSLFVVFITTFLVSFGFLALVFLNGIKIVGSPRRPRVQARAAAPRPAKVRRKLASPPEDALDALKAFEAESVPEPDDPEEPPEELQISESENILEAEPEPEPETRTLLSAAGEAQKAKMTTFIGTAAEEIQESGKVDAFSRFGVNLYVAGAVDSLATTQGLEASEALSILADAVGALGTPAEMARKFAESANDYLMQPKYVEMYESGRRSMMAFLEGDTDGPRQLTPALENWSNPTKTEEHSGPLAVLFTDIVGSTSMTVSVGDDAAQYVVRTHNRIVRSALTNFSGREVKHTGDGIMASFATVANSVEAAIEMQERVIANNKAEGDIPLHLCIGINAGEPVVEDNDLFGVTVQLSARLCAVAESDQIIVSEVVKGLCTGREIEFVSRGAREMKGFADPVPVYEVMWQNKNGA